MKLRPILLAFAASLLLPLGCRKVDPPVDNTEPRSLTRKASNYDDKMAAEWMQLGYGIIKTNYLYGPHAARTYGYLGLTVWESVCNGIPGAKSMAGQINDFPTAADIDRNKEYDWGIVLCTAMRAVVPELIDNVSAAQRGEIQTLANIQENEMVLKGTNDEVRLNSQELGQRVAQKIVERIHRDGRDVIRNLVPVIPTRDAEHKWYWDPKTYNQQPVEPLWGTVRTFVIDNSQSCEGAPPIPYSEGAGSPFHVEAKEVYDYYPLTDNARRIAYHWDNGPGRTCSSACHWVNIALQLLDRENKNLADAAKTFALTGFAVADAFSQCWYMKYKYFLLRPGTYIKEVIDPNWEAAIGTPPYPDYTSGSSTVGGAVPVVLAEIFGNVPFIDRTHLGSPLYTPDGGPWILPEREFVSLSKAGEEQALSRIIGGVHFRKACDEGLKSGRCIGNTVLARLDFGI